MWPSAEIWWAPAGENGLTTSDTWASGESAATILAVRSCTAAAVIGPVEVITTWAGLPFWSGKAWLRICWTGWAPPVRLLEKLLPTAWATTLVPSSATNHTSSTHQRWSWHQPAMRASALSSAGCDAARSVGGTVGVSVVEAMRRN